MRWSVVRIQIVNTIASDGAEHLLVDGRNISAHLRFPYIPTNVPQSNLYEYLLFCEQDKYYIYIFLCNKTGFNSPGERKFSCQRKLMNTVIAEEKGLLKITP